MPFGVELAIRANSDVNVLAETVGRCNALCVEGGDRDFGKPAKYMVPIKALFYIVRLDHMAMAAMGGICINRDFEGCTPDKKLIPGLHAIGLDGTILWRNVYAINVPDAANANNINSRRVAANNAAEYPQ
ncbi:FAD-binding protein [Raoultibacter massiliensis]|uniref:FAD-binding protein n=1 Tax=Raoultibacter massiliensis TaxID=1852371 RepID=UPI003A8DF429